MGIDARIVVRLKDHPQQPTDRWLQTTSWRLCESIGASKFFIQDGLLPAEYRAKSEAWHAAYQAHALYPMHKLAAEAQTHVYSGDPAGVRSRIVADIGEFTFKERRRALDLACADYTAEDFNDDFDAIPRAARRPGKVYTQDGPAVIAEPDEWLLRVSVWTRYYGIEYERGDLLTLCAIAEWLEVNVPNCEVWYGGDSSGVLLSPFGDEQRKALRRHMYSPLGRDYFNYMSMDSGPGGSKQKPPRPAPCSLCLPEGVQMPQHGTGPAYMAVNCAGCGKSFASRDNGITWTTEKEKDF